MEIIAHRGASHDAPENTLAAVQLAWEQNADAVEIDIQLSKDGRIVVFHDANTRRTAGRRKRLCDQTFAELQLLDAGAWKSPKYRAERIPTLDEIVSTIPPGKRLFVEFKCGPDSLDEFAAILNQSGRSPSPIVAIGFSIPTMKLVKRRLAQVEVCRVVNFKRDWRGRWLPTAAQLIQQARESGLDGVDVSAHGPLGPRFVEQIHDAGLKVYVWTVNTHSRAVKLAEAGVDGITTNRPGFLREKLAGGLSGARHG